MTFPDEAAFDVERSQQWRVRRGGIFELLIIDWTLGLPHHAFLPLKNNVGGRTIRGASEKFDCLTNQNVR
jgi:hypothetical protein